MTVNTSRKPKELLSHRLIASALLASTSGCQAFFPLPSDVELDETLAPVVTVAKVQGEPFTEGEVIIAKVLVEDVSVGTASIRVGKKCLLDGKPTLPLDGAGDLGGILAVFSDSSAATRGFIDLETGGALESRWDFDYDEKRLLVETDFAPGGFRMHQRREVAGQKPRNSVKRVELKTEQTPHDGHSLLGFLRRWDAEEGTQGFAYVFAGRYLMRIDMGITGRETIRTVLGDQEAIRIDGVGAKLSEKTLQPQPGTRAMPFVFWFSADERRVPLRIEVESDLGALTLELSKYEVVPPAQGDAQPCDGRVDKVELAKAKAPRPKRSDGKVPRFRRSPSEPPFGRDKAKPKDPTPLPAKPSASPAK